jgi:hypothetical protein
MLARDGAQSLKSSLGARMNRIVISTSIAALFIFTASFASPGAKSNFSGTWIMDEKRSVSATSGAPYVPITLSIKQTASTMSVETLQGDQSETIVYKLDGSQSDKAVEGNSPFQWRAQWDGAKIVTETHRNINGSTVTIKEAFILTGPKELTVDRTLIVQHGYTMRGTRNYSSGKDVFTKRRE